MVISACSLDKIVEHVEHMLSIVAEAKTRVVALTHQAAANGHVLQALRRVVVGRVRVDVLEPALGDQVARVQVEHVTVVRVHLFDKSTKPVTRLLGILAARVPVLFGVVPDETLVAALWHAAECLVGLMIAGLYKLI